MIAQYPGQCCFCSKPITVGVDTYDKESKRAWHEECFENQAPTPEVLALSQRLGFLSFDAALHWPWSQMRGEGQRTLWATSNEE